MVQHPSGHRTDERLRGCALTAGDDDLQPAVALLAVQHLGGLERVGDDCQVVQAVQLHGQQGGQLVGGGAARQCQGHARLDQRERLGRNGQLAVQLLVCIEQEAGLKGAEPGQAHGAAVDLAEQAVAV